MTFVPALSQIPSEMQIRRQLVKIVFGPRVWCPRCRRQLHVACIEKHRRWRCRQCRTKFSLTSVTWLRGCKLSLRHVWCLIWCWQKKLNVEQVSALLNISIPTVRRYYALFRDNLQGDVDVILRGTVQMDEMFTKGTVIVGAKDIKRKKLKLQVHYKRDPDKADALELIYRHVRPGSTLQTDGGGIYRGIQNWWPLTHKTDIHRKFEFALTSEIEGIWGNFRTFVRRMYHHVTVKTIAKVVAEFECRYSQPELFKDVPTFLQNSLCVVTVAF